MTSFRRVQLFAISASSDQRQRVSASFRFVPPFFWYQSTWIQLSDMARGSEDWVTSGMDVKEVEQKAKDGQLASAATDDEPAHPEDAGATADMKKTAIPERMDAVPDIQEAPPMAKGDQERAVDPETEDLGWSEDPDVPVPVVKGLKNEDLWVLVRRLNKVRQLDHQRAVGRRLTSSLAANLPRQGARRAAGRPARPQPAR